MMTPRLALELCHGLLQNLAAERPGYWNRVFGRRWVIADEPLRADARRLLPLVERALKADVLESAAESGAREN